MYPFDIYRMSTGYVQTNDLLPVAHHERWSTPRSDELFEKLPQELLCLIADSLSETERTCLALCNKSLYQRVPGTKTSLQDDLDCKFKLLHLLIRNIPAWLCYRCKRIHYGRQMFPGLWHLNPMQGASWRTVLRGNTKSEGSSGFPYCDFDVYTRADIHGNQRLQRYKSVLAYENDAQSNLCLESTFSTVSLLNDQVLGHKEFVFRARYGKWPGGHIAFSSNGVDLGVNIDFCKHLSLRRTQPGKNIIADILQCGWIMASHEYHGDQCTNATCQGGYKVPQGHEQCLPGVNSMRHSGMCEYCPTEFEIEMWPHWVKEEKVLQIRVWHDLSWPQFISTPGKSDYNFGSKRDSMLEAQEPCSSLKLLGKSSIMK